MHCAQQTRRMIRAFTTILFIYEYKQRKDEKVEELGFRQSGLPFPAMSPEQGFCVQKGTLRNSETFGQINISQFHKTRYRINSLFTFNIKFCRTVNILFR